MSDDRELTDDERRRELEAYWLRQAGDKYEPPPPLYDPDDPGLLSDEVGRNFQE